MARVSPVLLAFNRGEISRHALSRIDVDQLRLAAQEQINWLPMTLGPMTIRPGTEYLGSTLDDLPAKLIPFVFSKDDTAVIELSNQNMRVWVDDELVTRNSVATVITNGDFESDVGWTLTGSALITGGFLFVQSNGGEQSKCYRQVTCTGIDLGTEHGVQIIVSRDDCTFYIGTSAIADDIFPRTAIRTGAHSFAFTPTSDFYVVFESANPFKVPRISSVLIETAGTMVLPSTWTDDVLSLLRARQSADVIFVACEGIRPRRLERHGVHSWSNVLYQPLNGPFAAENPENPALNLVDFGSNPDGLVSNLDFFDAGKHTDTLFRLNTFGQANGRYLADNNIYSLPVRVVGTGTDRNFDYILDGTWAGTVTLQRSYDAPESGFVDVEQKTANGTYSVADGLDNLEVWYRLGFKPGDYTSGAVQVSTTYGGGGGTGVIDVTFVTDTKNVFGTVRSFMTSLDPTTSWQLGDWNPYDGYPTCVEIHDGRLFWARGDKIWGSVSDDYDNFDPDFIGDAGPLNRTIGTGATGSSNWLMSLSRLLLGRDGREMSIRSSSLDAPLTPTDFTMKDCSSQGSARLDAIKIDTSCVFVQQSGRRIYELKYDVDIGDYHGDDLTKFNFDIGRAGFVDLAVQRQPDTRIHFVRADGVVAVLSHDRDNGVSAWWRIETDGFVESVCVLPGDIEDNVYYVVRRTIDGNVRRYLEKFARQDECVGSTLNKNIDCHVTYSGLPVTTISGLTHLDGEEVVVWGNGKDLGAYTVTGGEVSGLPEQVTDAVVGLGYDATFMSAKLAYGAQRGTALNQTKKIERLGLNLIDTHYQGLKFGQSFDVMDDLPLIEEGTETPADTIWSEYDAPMIEVPGEWHTDSRLCLKASSPRPCTVAAVSMLLVTNE